MDRLTRKELKSDHFALEVQHGVQYVSGHRQQLYRWGGIALGVLLVALGVYFYMGYQRGIRQEALRQAFQIQSANVGAGMSEYALNFPTEADREKALLKALTDVAAKYPGTQEGIIAEYYLATNAADKGRTPEAEKRFKLVIDEGKAPIASLAKLALGQLYGSEGKIAEGKSLIQSVMDNPTVMVSKEQAVFAMAHLLEQSNPAEARKLLEPLRTSTRPAVSRAAVSALSSMPQK